MAGDTPCYQVWLNYLQNAEKTCLIQDGKRKVHYKFREGNEMVEEYSMETNVVLRRAWKVNKQFGAAPQWEVELGDPDPNFQQGLENIGLKESTTAPLISKRITKINIEWRIRNLPYPINVYEIKADEEKTAIIVKTTNKKFFKVIAVPDLERVNLKVEQDRITYTHKFNTLVITYKKPPELLLCEKLILEEITKIKTLKDGPVQCPQS